MRSFRLARPPRSLRRPTVHLDNVVLAPASLLHFKAKWQAVANDLPQGDILIVLPWQGKQRRIARAVATQLLGRGKRVRIIENRLLHSVF